MGKMPIPNKHQHNYVGYGSIMLIIIKKSHAWDNVTDGLNEWQFPLILIQHKKSVLAWKSSEYP